MYNSFSHRRNASPNRKAPQSEPCTSWQTIPRIATNHCAWPARLSRTFNNFSPGIWVIPPRCYWRHNHLSAAIHRGSKLFYRFKSGHSSLAFPLALVMYEVLTQQVSDFDCIVPIPLSPDKQKKGQLNRTRILAQALARSAPSNSCRRALPKWPNLETTVSIRRLNAGSIRAPISSAAAR